MSLNRLCVSALAALAVLASLVVPSAQAGHHSPLRFQPGHYRGFTTQKCPAEPAPAGMCQPGRRLPISFTVSSKRISNVRAVVVTHCMEGPMHVVHDFRLPNAKIHIIKRKWANVLTEHKIGSEDGVAGSDLADILVRGRRALGTLETVMTINAAGRPEGQSHNTCDTSPGVHWHATRQGGR